MDMPGEAGLCGRGEHRSDDANGCGRCLRALPVFLLILSALSLLVVRALARPIGPTVRLGLCRVVGAGWRCLAWRWRLTRGMLELTRASLGAAAGLPELANDLGLLRRAPTAVLAVSAAWSTTVFFLCLVSLWCSILVWRHLMLEFAIFLCASAFVPCDAVGFGMYPGDPAAGAAGLPVPDPRPRAMRSRLVSSRSRSSCNRTADTRYS